MKTRETLIAVHTRSRIISLDSGVRLRIPFASAAIASLLASSAAAQSSASPPQAASPLGIWRGTSVCLVRPSSCNDETVVYRITQLNTQDTVAMDARKIVRGEEQEMGMLHCHLTSSTDVALTCPMPNGTWRFTVRRDSLVGELRLPDNTKFRDVRATRSR